jgi:hypothetical protein
LLGADIQKVLIHQVQKEWLINTFPDIFSAANEEGNCLHLDGAVLLSRAIIQFYRGN